MYEKKDKLKIGFLRKLYLIFKIKLNRNEYIHINQLKLEVTKEKKKVEILLKINTKMKSLLDENYKKTKDIINSFINFKKGLDKEEGLEKFWNNRRPKSNRMYQGRPDPTNPKKNMWVDPRIYFQYDSTLPTYKGSNDEIACKCLDSVRRKIKYTSEKQELWEFAFETLKTKQVDCDGGSILMANMMIMSGIPYYRIRLNAGSVQGGGHAYVTYLAEKDNKWYILDWCYYYNESKGLKKTWKDAKKYFGIWFSWNPKYVFEGATLDKPAKEKKK